MAGLIESTDANAIIQEECGELYDMLVAGFQDYNITTGASQTVSAGQDYVSLPADFYKLRGVDLQSGADWVDMEPFSLSERNDLGTRRYMVHGDKLLIRPASEAPGTVVRLLYTPVCPPFTADTGTPFDDRGFAKRAILAAAIRFVQLEERDTGALERRLAAIDQRIEAMRMNRDSARPKRAQDTRRDLRYRLRHGYLPEELP